MLNLNEIIDENEWFAKVNNSAASIINNTNELFELVIQNFDVVKHFLATNEKAYSLMLTINELQAQDEELWKSKPKTLLIKK